MTIYKFLGFKSYFLYYMINILEHTTYRKGTE